ncbi:hypothetical protein M885DRAFT_614702 [Pelagophyceae sp. CCMP2097]|nr:hypothetical protein M885DRAFT_614702 [Pelagophyceae sp. CCMP2097]|mmetsp:Transcript_4013/g.12382  ORF Transcript_4013/g.12382 Transcript_4013/m.12382 type:complete len:177 (+) Transcript_4013:68-598(+)
MSGAKRGSGYRKSVTEDVMQSFPLPENGDVVVRVNGIRGGNLVEVSESNKANAVLALLPTRFKNLIWIKRGDFLIAASAGDTSGNESGDGAKVRFIVKHVLYREQIRHIKAHDLWPHDLEDDAEMPDDGNLCAAVSAAAADLDDDAAPGDESDDDLFVNTNRRVVKADDSGDESDD